MLRFKNILLPTDFTAHARSAVKYAAAFARESQGRILLFSVQSGSVPPNLMTLPGHVLGDPDNHWLVQLREQVRELLADPLLAGIEVEPVIIEGEPATEIARAVREFGIDLVTVVTHGRKGLARALWGSTAEEIIAEAPCPVLTIRPPQRDFAEHRGSETHIRLNRILLATNLQPGALPATRTALDLARQTGAEIHIIYVIADYLEQMAGFFPDAAGQQVSRLREHVTERLESLAREAGSGAQTHIVEGRPYAEIVTLAFGRDVDLIVIGTSVHSSLFGGAPVLGSEIERVVRNAPCPVLCVPAGRAVTPAPSVITQPVPQAS